MEERKRLGPLGAVGLVLLALILAAACFLAAGWGSLELAAGPYGVYAIDIKTVFYVSALEYADQGALLVTRRDGRSGSGNLVTYLEGGFRHVEGYDAMLERFGGMTHPEASCMEPVVFVLPYGSAVLRLLYAWRFWIWGVTAGVALILLVLRLTSDARWRKRQQKLMLKNFREYGEKYAREDEELDY